MRPQKPSPVVLALVSIFILVLFFTVSVAAALDVRWEPKDIPAAMEKARREHKLLYIFVEGDNCPPCDSFKFSHLGDPVFADFVNTLFVPIRMHEGNADDRTVLATLRLTHGAVPRFYVLTSEGRGVSMSIGSVPAAPMGAVEVLRMAAGHALPVDRNAAAQLALRIRTYANMERAAGRLYPDGTNRDAAVAAVEAWSWALAGRLDEAANAWGPQWAARLAAPELAQAHADFWTKWNNPTSAPR